MDTPPNSTETHMVTRSILAEIPTTTLELGQDSARRVDQIPNIVNSYFGFAASKPKLISPDELVIQQRGRRVLPIVFSPDIDTVKQNIEETQTESGGLNRNSVLLRRTRKRLLYDSPEPSTSRTNQIDGEEPQTETSGDNRSSINLRSARQRLPYDSPGPSSSGSNQIDGEEPQTETSGDNKSSINLRSSRKRLLYNSPGPSSSGSNQINKEESQTESSGHNKGSINLRSARKRLLYDSPGPSSSGTNQTNDPIAKKMRTEPTSELPEDNCMLLAMKALTSEQLIGIIGQIVDDHPTVEKEIRTYFPNVDLKSHEERICYLRRNIYKALPSCRLISKTDSTAYNRVSSHLMDFKKYVIDQGRLLAESSQWVATMDYIFMAWKHVSNTPIWDHPPHNAARRQCFKSLAAICMYTLKHMMESNTLSPNQCENYKMQLKFLSDDDEESLLSCLKFLNTEVKFD